MGSQGFNLGSESQEQGTVISISLQFFSLAFGRYFAFISIKKEAIKKIQIDSKSINFAP
jgi:hypothetical protein